ncbi:MAG TPA: transglycosylase SLT domain-containing protein [Terriglobales bacterium]|nr:transglycosylase SLT domain-containing protein [Terriglobales bacterium]
MRFAAAVLGCVVLLLAGLPAKAAGPAPVRLSQEARERFAAAVTAFRAGDWAQAAREFGEVSRIAAPIAEYALLEQAESLARLGDSAGSRAAAQQAADTSPESRAVPPALLLAAEQASRTGDDAAAAGLWRRFLDRFPDHAEALRTRLRMGQSLAAAGRAAEAAAAFREIWLTAPATPYADAAARELRSLEARGIPVPAVTQSQRIERAERVAAAGLGDQARAEAEAVLAEGPPVELALKALRVVVDGTRRTGHDDAALAATNRALGLATGERRAPWLLESAKIQQKKNREGAVAALDRLVADYPRAPEADDALLLKARILESGPDPKAAEPVYLKLAQNYPESEEGIAAQWRLGWLSWLRSDFTEAAERWSRITAIRTASQNYRDAALYWTARAQAAAGQTESAAKYYAQLISESPRSYHGILALRRVPRTQPSAGRNPAATQLAASLPADPREFLQTDASYARIEALYVVGLGDFADEEMDELVRRSVADARRLYALSTVYAQDSRYFLSLRILRRHFLGLARSAPPAVPRTFWEAFYPLGWRWELNEAASNAAVDPYLVAAIVREESSYNAQARSRVGARGLMQLMPDTAKPMARQRGLLFNDGALLDEPAANLTLGSAHLAGLLKEFGDPRLAVAAYNAGATPVRQWWKARPTDDMEVWVELIPFTETRGFVRRVMLAWEEYRRLYGGAAGARP